MSLNLDDIRTIRDQLLDAREAHDNHPITYMLVSRYDADHMGWRDGENVDGCIVRIVLPDPGPLRRAWYRLKGWWRTLRG